MSFAWKGVALILALTCVGAVADTFLKLASSQVRPFWNRWFVFGLACSAVFAVIWVLLMQTMKLATAGVVTAVASALLLVCIGIFVFGEKLSGAESTGVIMALCAVVLLGRLSA